MKPRPPSPGLLFIRTPTEHLEDLTLSLPKGEISEPDSARGSLVTEPRRSALLRRLPGSDNQV